jgi:hypothetical protein
MEGMGLASQRFMRRLTILGTVVALLAMAVPGAALAGNPKAGRCSDGTMLAGTYRGFVVTGTCTIADGANVHIKGDLIIAAGASLNDHGAEGWVGSHWVGAEMHITGDVHIGRGAVLGLGWNSPDGEGSLGPDTVGGNIVANRPLALQVGQVTVGGNLISIGGGVLSTSLADFRNFPVKDNVIHGNLIVAGWRGGWFGAIRNHVDRNVIITNVVSRSNGDTGPGMDTDSTEVMGSDLSAVGGPVIPQTIGGNLICFGNVPDAQVNPEDFGAKNIVGGRAIGECAGLSQ